MTHGVRMCRPCLMTERPYKPEVIGVPRQNDLPSLPDGTFVSTTTRYSAHALSQEQNRSYQTLDNYYSGVNMSFVMAHIVKLD